MLTLGSGTILAAPWYTGGQVQPPTGVILSQTATTGALSNGTYYVQVTAFNGNGESGATAEQSIVLNGGGAVQKLTVTFTAPVAGPVPTGYRVYVALATQGFASAQGTTAASPYNQTIALVTSGAQARIVGLLPIGEVAGDIDVDISWQEKDFYGQSNFPISRGFYGGKGLIRAKKVEPIINNIDQIISRNVWSQLGTVGSGSDVYSIVNSDVPGFFYVQFVHTRSDVAGKTVMIEGFKMTSKQLVFLWSREDISHNDWEFNAVWDSSVSKFITVTATQ